MGPDPDQIPKKSKKEKKNQDKIMKKIDCKLRLADCTVPAGLVLTNPYLFKMRRMLKFLRM